LLIFCKIGMMRAMVKRADLKVIILEVYQVSETNQREAEEPRKPIDKLDEVEVSKISSPTLARLIEEVRNEESCSAHAYNRMHNRHNRSR
jgi:hypothetical protein